MVSRPKSKPEPTTVRLVMGVVCDYRHKVLSHTSWTKVKCDMTVFVVSSLAVPALIVRRNVPGTVLHSTDRDLAQSQGLQARMTKEVSVESVHFKHGPDCIETTDTERPGICPGGGVRVIDVWPRTKIQERQTKHCELACEEDRCRWPREERALRRLDR